MITYFIIIMVLRVCKPDTFLAVIVVITDSLCSYGKVDGAFYLCGE